MRTEGDAAASLVPARAPSTAHGRSRVQSPMNINAMLGALMRNVAALGAARLALITGAILMLAGLVAAGIHLATRPDFETLYANLDRQDVIAMGDALSRAGIRFDVSTDGASVLVPPAQVAQARMLLAGQGLPRSTNAGYELFDNVGSLGLTSFMQEVTLVRALEGEIGRTITAMRGVSAARVHLVLPSQRGLSRDRTRPTASVVVRTDGLAPSEQARAIRHLVAAAVPGLNVDGVTVMDTEGTLLAGGAEAGNPGADALFGLERTVSATIEQNIRRALLPAVGADNLRISVAARLNTDKRETNETVYDPDGRVERSVRVSRESGDAQNKDGAAAATVTEEMPEDAQGSGAGTLSSEKNERRDETTEYALSARQTATQSDGYRMEGLSIAVVVNKAALLPAPADGAAPAAEPDPALIEARLSELKALVIASAGIDEARGDKVTVTALAFAPDPEAVADAGGGVAAFLAAQTGTLIRSGVLLVVAGLILMLGVRPALRMATREPAALAADAADPQLAPPAAGEDPAADVAAQLENQARKRLERIIALDEDKAVAVLKQWLRDDGRNAA